MLDSWPFIQGNYGSIIFTHWKDMKFNHSFFPRCPSHFSVICSPCQSTMAIVQGHPHPTSALLCL